jgi:hypothetical protein
MRYLKQVVAACLALLLMVQATGCTGWRAVTQPLPEALVQHPNRKVRVTLQDGRTIEADSAKAGADALITYQREGVDTLPLAQVKAVQVRLPSTWKTVGLVLGLGAVLFVALAAFQFHEISKY